MRRPGEAHVATQIDLRILELVCSRLCHDLVGPVGAVNNGIELLEEFDPSMADDVLPLLRNSARQAWRRLDFFRLAFGAAGGRESRTLGELGRYAAGWVASDSLWLNIGVLLACIAVAMQIGRAHV